MTTIIRKPNGVLVDQDDTIITLNAYHCSGCGAFQSDYGRCRLCAVYIHYAKGWPDTCNCLA